MTPPELLLEYLSKQPDTIRENLYAQAGMDFVVEGGIEAETDFVEVVKKLLAGGTDYRNFRHAVLICAELDFVFSRPRQGAGFAKHLEQVADQSGSNHLKRLALQAPLRDKHFEKAAEDWAALRQSVLSEQALHGYEATLWATSARMRLNI